MRWLSPDSPRTTVRVRKDVRSKLWALKQKYGFRTYDSLLNFAAEVLAREDSFPPATHELVFRDSRPAIVTGASGAGKTTAVKDLLSHYEGSVFMIDVAGEYADLKSVDLGKFFAVDWGHRGRMRFLPNPNVEISRAEAATIFSHLNFVKNSGSLKDWCLVVEEGHRFGQDPNLRALLIEARKFVRKLILVTTDWRLYEGIAQVYRPAMAPSLNTAVS